MPDLLTPYQGGVVRTSEAAQESAKAAQDWSASEPPASSVAAPTGLREVKGVQNLDADSQNSRQEVLRMMRSTPPKPATIINFLPWPLTFGANNRFVRGITVPACLPSMPYAHHHIRGYRMDWEYNENGTLKFKPVLPIHMASEFMREFGSGDGYGCGVIIYEGDYQPDRLMDVETYDPRGRPVTIERDGFEYDEEERRIAATIQVPVRRSLTQMMQAQRSLRNKVFMDRVRKADHDYHLPDGRGKWLVNDTHLLMAQVLLAEGEIQKLPDWNLSSRFEAGLSENNCPACGVSPKAEAFKCSGCGHILNALAAYKASAIEYGHVSFDAMSSDELEEAEGILAEREQTKKRVGELMKAKRKAAKEAEQAAAQGEGANA